MRTTPAQRLLVAFGALAPALGWVAGSSVVPACGGSQGALPATPDAAATSSDPGSGPFDCHVADPYEMHVIEDFEFGAATGWYTNNEVCYPWTQAVKECAEAGMVCYPGSQATPECLQDAAPIGVWADCFGSGAVDCADAAAALAGCQAQCLSVQPSPSFNADQLPAEAIPNGGRCGSQFGLHVKAGPFANWGGSVGTRFALPFDASGYDGIAVWMRTAQGFSISAKLAISDQHTDSQYNQTLESQGLPHDCDPNPNCQVQTAQGNSNCYNVGCDKFGSYTPLIENWRLFLLPFAEMRQGGWGRQRPEADLSAVLSIEINFAVGTWDFWIDDIAFYRLKPR